jgi:hypothetical protein
VRRLLLVLATSLLAVLALAQPAGAEQVQANDPANDVPYDRGDITFFRAIHSSSALDLRLRTQLGGNPENVWPNKQTYIQWRIDTDFEHAGPEYYAEIRIATGEDTVMLGRVKRVSDNHVMCTAQNHVPGDNIVVQQLNTYRFKFLRGCVGAPNELRVRATFRWDDGNANVGPVYTDYAPNAGPTQPLSFF